MAEPAKKPAAQAAPAAPKAAKKKSFEPYRPGRRFCPKDGAPVHLAEHKDRWSCGRCGYMEVKAK